MSSNNRIFTNETQNEDILPRLYKLRNQSGDTNRLCWALLALDYMDRNKEEELFFETIKRVILQDSRNIIEDYKSIRKNAPKFAESKEIQNIVYLTNRHRDLIYEMDQNASKADGRDRKEPKEKTASELSKESMIETISDIAILLTMKIKWKIKSIDDIWVRESLKKLAKTK